METGRQAGVAAAGFPAGEQHSSLSEHLFPMQRQEKSIGEFVGLTQGACSKTQLYKMVHTATVHPTKSNSVAKLCCAGFKKEKRKFSHWRGSWQSLEISNHNLITFSVEKQRIRVSFVMLREIMRSDSFLTGNLFFLPPQSTL